MRALAHSLTVDRPKYGTAASGQHTVTALREFVDQRLFKIAKSLFARLLEVGPYAAAQPLFRNRITVNERQAQFLRDLPADGGFAGAGETDQEIRLKVRLL